MPALTPENELIRARNISASEVAALVAEHPYTSPAAIYDRLVGGGGEPRKTSEAMSLGSFFEERILRYAEQRDGFRARLNRRTFEHPEVRLCATPDAFVVAPRPGLFVPERALVEIKMSGRGDQWLEPLPYVDWQCRAQMACTGRDTVYVYVLAGMRLLTFQLYRDPDKEDRMLDAVQSFWTNHVVARVRPEPTVSAPVMPFSFDADRATPEKEAVAP
jgi:predicted phage-related endonuclease